VDNAEYIRRLTETMLWAARRLQALEEVAGNELDRSTLRSIRYALTPGANPRLRVKEEE